MKHDNGGPAFPRDHAHDGHNGMTLRDYFAAMALTAISGPAWGTVGSRLSEPALADETAQEAYAIADAMLRARASATGGE
jgi:hypothetical protein